MTVFFYVLECSVEKCTAEFYLNDVPVIRRGEDIGKHFSGQSNQYLVDGVNEISILVNPGPTPSQAVSGFMRRRSKMKAAGAKAAVTLCKYPFGATVGGPSREVLATLEWAAEDAAPEMVFPRVATTTVDLGPLFGPWEWQTAELIELRRETLSAIGDELSELRVSLEAGDPEPFIAMGETRLAEIARAYSQAPGKKERIIRKAMDDDSSQPWWGMQPLDKGLFDFRICGKGRMVEAVGADWEPVLKEKPDLQKGVGMYSMMLGRVEGKWKILR